MARAPLTRTAVRRRELRLRVPQTYTQIYVSIMVSSELEGPRA